MVRSAQWILVAALNVALAMDGFDCLGIATPEQAMQCCNRMHCHLQSHHSYPSQECCKTTPQITHSAIGQPSSVQEISFSPAVLGVVQAFTDAQVVQCTTIVISGHSHDPPLSCCTPIMPLRI